MFNEYRNTFKDYEFARSINLFRHILNRAYLDYKENKLSENELFVWTKSKDYDMICSYAFVDAKVLAEAMLDKNDVLVGELNTLY